MKRLDVIANIAALVASIALLGFLGDTWYVRHHTPRSSQAKAKALIGTAVKLPGVDFHKNNKTLLIAISETCYFCEESQPFYRQLTKQKGMTATLLAVLPTPQASAENFVHTFISPSLSTVSSSLGAIGVHGTPTLLLIDREGRVTRAWVGKLDNAGEEQVQSLL